MHRLDIVHTILLAVSALSMEIIEEAIPDYGYRLGPSRLPVYKNVLDLTGHVYIRFAVRAAHDAHIMFSERPANSIDYSTDSEYAELVIGGWSNTRSILRMGTMEGQ